VDEHHLEAFLAVARYGTIKEASRHLHLSQSSVTSRLQGLERRLGTVLVDRGPGRPRATLTPEGEELLDLAERWEDLAREMRSLARRGDSSLSIGAPDSVNHYILAPVYADLARRHPELRLRVETANSAELYSKIEHREVDIAFVLYDRDLVGIRIELFLSEPMFVATRAELPVAAGRVDRAALDPMQEIHIAWGAHFERWRAQRGRPFVGAIYLDTAHLITAFLDDRRKWAVVPDSMARAIADAHGFSIYRLAEPPPDRLLYYARRTRLNSSSQRGYELFAEAIERVLPTDERWAHRIVEG
jgi:DNA-binding transcriptional LysR family regulator